MVCFLMAPCTLLTCPRLREGGGGRAAPSTLLGPEVAASCPRVGRGGRPAASRCRSQAQTAASRRPAMSRRMLSGRTNCQHSFPSPILETRPIAIMVGCGSGRPFTGFLCWLANPACKFELPVPGLLGQLQGCHVAPIAVVHCRPFDPTFIHDH